MEELSEGVERPSMLSKASESENRSEELVVADEQEGVRGRKKSVPGGGVRKCFLRRVRASLSVSGGWCLLWGGGSTRFHEYVV